MLDVFKKYIQKDWLMGTVPVVVIASMIPLIAAIWPELEDQAEAFQEILQSPVYQAMLGDLTDLVLTEWSGVFGMYIFVWAEFIILFVTIFIPTRYIGSEVDKGTLDMILSFPIPRWQFLLEKFSVYTIYNLLYVVLLLPISYVTTELINETLDYYVLTLSLISMWLTLFALGAIALLCATVTLEGNKSYGLAGVIILGQYLLEKIGGLSESLNIYQNLSLFHYVKPSSIINSGTLPLDETVIVLVVGGVALILALYSFDQRDLAI